MIFRQRLNNLHRFIDYGLFSQFPKPTPAITATFKTGEQVIRAGDEPRRCSSSAGPVVLAFLRLCNKSQPQSHWGVWRERCSTGSSSATTRDRGRLIGWDGDHEWRIWSGHIPVINQVPRYYFCKRTCLRKKRFSMHGHQHCAVFFSSSPSSSSSSSSILWTKEPSTILPTWTRELIFTLHV